MKDFTIFFEHTEYGYYSTKETANNIQEALNYFVENYAYKKVYGIMEVS